MPRTPYTYDSLYKEAAARQEEQNIYEILFFKAQSAGLHEDHILRVLDRMLGHHDYSK